MSREQFNEDAQQRVELGLRIRRAREYVGMSQDEVASALGLSRPAVTHIESGMRKVEALELSKLASLLGVTTEVLLSGNEAVENERVAFLARATQGLSESDLDQLYRFTEYLRNSSKPSRRGK
ncbi:helix-turn-helix domain-containing protein [Massilia cavernae]|uniref:XRE family transcriptional regulator n=1 Tax=Massilia cavernae TaxID=2320864 RepID=A0A418XGW3_9BURK|nr:helix-turn-helix transcriptional regulator [Massilia cavernae]RJG11709.1 XRE family transcriptional regulator [Massilia cavernae]